MFRKASTWTLLILLACFLSGPLAAKDKLPESTKDGLKLVHQHDLGAVYLKPGATLVNIGRGGLIVDHALLAALDRGRLDTAVLDVFRTEPLPKDDPLWSHPGVRLTAHTSFNGDGVQDRWDALFIDNIARYARGVPLAREVDPADI